MNLTIYAYDFSEQCVCYWFHHLLLSAKNDLPDSIRYASLYTDLSC